MKRLLPAFLLLILVPGCTKLVTVPVETVGKVCCTTIKTTGDIAVGTVQALTPGGESEE